MKGNTMQPCKHLNAWLWLCVLVSLGALLALTGCPGKSPSVGVPPQCQGVTPLPPECFTALYHRYSPLLRAAVQTATGIYLSQHPERAEPMYKVVASVQQRSAQEELTTLSRLEAVVRDTVQWDTLQPGVRLGVESLLSAVRVALEGLISDMGVTQPAQAQVVTRDVVQWVREAVVVQCSTCIRQEIGQRQ